jgi:hypothetical protein
MMEHVVAEVCFCSVHRWRSGHRGGGVGSRPVFLCSLERHNYVATRHHRQTAGKTSMKIAQHKFTRRNTRWSNMPHLALGRVTTNEKGVLTEGTVAVDSRRCGTAGWQWPPVRGHQTTLFFCWAVSSHSFRCMGVAFRCGWIQEDARGGAAVALRTDLSTPRTWYSRVLSGSLPSSSAIVRRAAGPQAVNSFFLVKS